MKRVYILLIGILTFLFLTVSQTSAICIGSYCLDAGGRNYGPKSYYDVYNQLCPQPLGYVPMEVMLEMLETQDNSLCETTNNSNSTDADGNSNTDGDTQNNNGENENGNSGNDDKDLEDKETKTPIVTDDMTNKPKDRGVRTTPNDAPFCVTCYVDTDEETLYGRITLYDNNGELRTAIGKRKIYDVDGNELFEEITDYIYIEPEKLPSYLNQEELDKCKEEKKKPE